MNNILYFWAVGAVTLFMSVIWNRKTWTNVCIKLVFIVLFLWSVFNILVANGYLVKAAS